MTAHTQDNMRPSENDPAALEQHFDRLYRELFIHSRKKPSRHDGTTRVLADYLKGIMLNRQWTPYDLAKACGFETDWHIQAVLEGGFPTDELEDDFIEALARAIDCDTGIIHILAGRTPRHDARVEQKRRELRELMEQLSEMFFEKVDERYSPEVEDDEPRRTEYDAVIRTLEQMIARHRDAIRREEKNVRELPRTGEYEAVIRKLEGVLRRQREELESVQELIDALDNPRSHRFGNTEIEILTLKRIVHRVKHDENNQGKRG